jgi:hypothetical protein
VQHLVAIDIGRRSIKGEGVNEWMVAGNGAAVLSGSSPVDYLNQVRHSRLRGAGAPGGPAGEDVAGTWRKDVGLIAAAG